MKKLRVAINGFGRIGRLVFRAGYNDPKIDWVAINNPSSTEQLTYLLKYDSTYGRFPAPISYTGDTLIVRKKKITILHEREPQKLPWKKLNIDIVIETSGLFTHKQDATRHVLAGAKKVLISANSKDADAHIVMGVNHNTYNKKKHTIISNCSCTTNCAAQLAKVLHDTFGVKECMVTTIHGYTASQNLVDGSTREKDIRRARNASTNIVPSTTGASDALGDVIAGLYGKLSGFSYRVPVPTGSIATLFCTLNKKTTVEQLNTLYKKESAKKPQILGYSEDPIVSSDIIGDTRSCVFDPHQTLTQGTLVSVSGWYDNEFGYANRVIDLLKTLL